MLGYREISTEGLVGKMRFKMAASSQLHKKRIVKFVASNYDFEADFFHGNRFFFLSSALLFCKCLCKTYLVLILIKISS